MNRRLSRSLLLPYKIYLRSLRLSNMALLHPLECAFVDGTEARLPYPPVFIIGPPRSGSTVLYQVLLDHFHFSYFSNLHELFFGAPSLAERLFRPSRRRVDGCYCSKYGRTEGWSAPSECGNFWYRFFRRRPQFTSLADVSGKQLRKLRGVVRRLQNAMGKPILFKNGTCALRLDPLAKALPEAIFLITRRDVLDVSHSLLAARKDIHGDYARWWSMEPPNVTELKEKPAHKQVVEQVRSIYALVDESRERLGAERFLDVHYEEFCQDTRSVLEKIQNFLARHGIPVPSLGEVPALSQRNGRSRIDPGLYRKLKEYVSASA
ncbi:MAG: sulfotransferase [Planctomycetes bacterium]|nr:sulfotransferase [Planctomycetota bacterium]